MDVRCPVGPKRLFARLRVERVLPVIVEGNLVEVACPDCKRALREEGRRVAQVLHRFNLAAQLVETEVVLIDQG
jgi:hypothetical protein